MLLLSIVVPNYNYGHFLEHCLNSLAAQSLGPQHFEIIVADDGSTDDSLERVRLWGAAHPHMSLRLSPGPHRGHPGAVRNRGVAAARAALVLCVDADDMLESATLEALVVQIHGEEAKLCEGTGPHGAQKGDILWAPDCVEVQGEILTPVPVPDFDADLVRRQHPLSSAVCFSKALWQAVGGYDEHNPYEDWDFLLRAVARGAVWYRVPGAVLLYRMHGGSVSEKARSCDGKAKADMVLRSADFFAPQVVWWAHKVREGVPWVIPFPRGVIPTVENLRQWHAACVVRMGEKVAHFFPSHLFDPGHIE